MNVHPTRDRLRFLRLGAFLPEGMMLEVLEDYESQDHVVPGSTVQFRKGDVFVLNYLFQHGVPPQGENPNEDNTSSRWVIVGAGLRKSEQSSKQILEAVLAGRLRRRS